MAKLRSWAGLDLCSNTWELCPAFPREGSAAALRGGCAGSWGRADQLSCGCGVSSRCAGGATGPRGGRGRAVQGVRAGAGSGSWKGSGGKLVARERAANFRSGKQGLGQGPSARSSVSVLTGLHLAPGCAQPQPMPALQPPAQAPSVRQRCSRCLSSARSSPSVLAVV